MRVRGQARRLVPPIDNPMVPLLPSLAAAPKDTVRTAFDVRNVSFQRSASRGGS